MNGLPLKDHRGIKRPEDPYDFEDDLGSGATLETYKRKDGLDKEEAKTPGSVQSTHDPHSPSQPKKTSGNLYTSAGLQPSLSDLDELFDSDSPVDDVRMSQQGCSYSLSAGAPCTHGPVPESCIPVVLFLFCFISLLHNVHILEGSFCRYHVHLNLV